MTTRITLFPTISFVLAFICGCMTSRSRCNVEYKSPTEEISSGADVNTVQKYTIRKVRTNSYPSLIDDSVISEVAGSISSAERIMHSCPGVFEQNGNGIFVDIISCSRTSSYRWTAIPCLLTAGICPYFQNDETTVTAEVVAVSNPNRKVRFSYKLIDDWKISFLFQLGSIPYSEGALRNARIGKRGSGDISPDVHREGFAIGVAMALKELERSDFESK